MAVVDVHVGVEGWMWESGKTKFWELVGFLLGLILLGGCLVGCLVGCLIDR